MTHEKMQRITLMQAISLDITFSSHTSGKL